MKKNITKILLIITLILPIFINAKSYSYQSAVNQANQYITKFKDYNDYIEIGNMPYNYEEQSNRYNVNFKKGGFISRDEYSITNVYGSSYLATGLEYWTLTQAGYNSNHTIDFKLSERVLSEQTGVRSTSYTKTDAKVSGAGTKNDPWVFLSLRNVNVISADDNRGTLSLSGCTTKSEGKKEVVVPIYDTNDGVFYYCEDDFFRYQKTTCTSYISRELGTSNKMFIDSSIQDNTICKIIFGHKTLIIQLKSCTGCTEISQKTVYFAKNKTGYFRDQYGDEPLEVIDDIPEKTGYTFEGYYKNNTILAQNKIINSTGKFVSNELDTSGDLSNPTSLIPNMEPNKYSVKFDCNGGTGTMANAPYTYDLEGTLPATGCSRTNYEFNGWEFNGKKYADQDKVINLTADPNGVVTLKAVWKDIKEPEKPTYEAYYSSNNEVYVSGTWTNQEVYTKITAVDNETGVARIEYSTNKSSWTKLNLAKSNGVTGTHPTYTGSEAWTLRNERVETVYFRVCDFDNNCSEPSDGFTMRYDTAAPTCKVSASGTKSSDGTFFVATTSVSLSDKTDTGGSSLNGYDLTTSSTATFNSNTSGSQGNAPSGVTWYGHVRDVAGNVGRCSLKVVVKSKPPTISFSLSGSTSTATCYDGQTGAKIGTNTKSVGNSTHTWTCTDAYGLSRTCSQSYKKETHTSTGGYSCACTGCCGTCKSGWCYCCCGNCGSSSYTVVSKSGGISCN